MVLTCCWGQGVRVRLSPTSPRPPLPAPAPPTTAPAPAPGRCGGLCSGCAAPAPGGCSGPPGRPPRPSWSSAWPTPSWTHPPTPEPGGQPPAAEPAPQPTAGEVWVSAGARGPGPDHLGLATWGQGAGWSGVQGEPCPVLPNPVPAKLSLKKGPPTHRQRWTTQSERLLC